MNRLNLAFKSIEFVALGLIFFCAGKLLNISDTLPLIAFSLMFSIPVSIAVWYLRRKPVYREIANYKFKILLSNAGGIMCVASIMSIGGLLLSAPVEFIATVILASVMAFFVLGTLTSLYKSYSQSV